MKLRSDQEGVLLELYTDLLAKILINLTPSYQTLSFYFGIFPITTLKPFVPNAPFLYPLKTSKNHKVF